MNLKDLVENTDWRNVKAHLLALYPKEERSVRGYEEVFATLSAQPPKPTSLRLVLEWVEDETVGDKPFVDVCGKDDTRHRDLEEFREGHAPEDDTYADAEVCFGLEFTPWAEWLGIEIDAFTRAQFSELDIVVHSLWEMTFLGYEEATIREQKEELEKVVEEVDRMTPEEREAKLIPWEDIQKELHGEGEGADAGG